MMKCLIVPFAITLGSAAELIQADLDKLNDPEKALEEVTRIVIGQRKDSYSLNGYQFLKAEQADGNPPFYVLTGEKNYRSSFRSFSDYEVKNPEEIFGANRKKFFVQRQPSLTTIYESVVYIFDHKGAEIHPFGGNNYIDGGYLYDFNGDGILDRAESTHFGLDDVPDHELEVLEILTVEPKPRELLKVVFNWHPFSDGDANDWTYRCTDVDADGKPEIRFGPAKPRAGENPDAFVFRWDTALQQFTAGEIPKGSHILVMKKSDSLESIAAAGGLGYPLVGGSAGGEKSGVAQSAQNPFQYQSFTNRPDQELAAFFKGASRRDDFSGAEGSTPNTIPEEFFSMEPKQAALALAEANRTAAHRGDFQLALDDRHGTALPASGWMLYSWSSSGCYSLSTELYAIHFGVADPVLLQFGYNTIGVVGRNQWADQPAHSAKIVKLSPKEATFLAETLFWLDRIRSLDLRRNSDSSFSGLSCSADGHAQMQLHTSSGAPRKLAEGTFWMAHPVSARWEGNYDRQVGANLAGIFLLQGVPRLLQDRWQKQNHPEPHSLRTATEERLRDRLGADARKQLQADFAAILAMDSVNPLATDIIVEIAEAASQESLVTLMPALQNQLNALAPVSAEEKEYEVLAKRFENPFDDIPKEQKQAHDRLLALREKRNLSRDSTLRQPLTDAVEKLRMASDPKLLQKAVREKSANARWALTLLRRAEPATWGAIVAADFPAADAENKQTILSTLIAGHPPAAAALLATFSEKQRRQFILEIAAYHQIHAPDQIAKDIPLIIRFMADRKENIYRRGEAMALLPKLPLSPSQLAECTKLLHAEIKNPQIGEYSFTTIGSALTALAALPNPEKHLDFLLSISDLHKKEFSDAYDAIDVMTRTNPQREKILADFLRTQFIESAGMMNQHFASALRDDLRSLSKDIAAFASESPAFEDGDGSYYSGGNFKSPVGQRYHIAREITALWSEKNPQTLARLWIAFVAAHPRYFSLENGDTSLKNLAATYIRALPAEQIKAHIQSILTQIPLDESYPETQDWLNSLAP
jgi:hypothetical protein